MRDELLSSPTFIESFAFYYFLIRAIKRSLSFNQLSILFITGELTEQQIELEIRRSSTQSLHLDKQAEK